MEKEKIIEHIIDIESLRNESRVSRIFKRPLKTIHYYFFATLARIHPFSISFKTLWGEDFYADLPNGNTFLYYGYPEANLTNYLIRNITDKSVFIDGGANIGFYSMLVSYLNKNLTTVHSFEPAPATFEKLLINCKNKNIQINNCALLNEVKEIKFIDYGLGYNSFNSIFRRDTDNIKALKKRGKEIVAQATTIDIYCSEKSIVPTFIKLDLEGSEYLALQGAKAVIEKYKPDISLEVAGDEEWSENIHNADRFLKELGYISYKINLDGTIEKHTMEESYKYDNLIYKYDSN